MHIALEPAPTMATSFPGVTLIETDQPNESISSPSEARSFCSTHCPVA